MAASCKSPARDFITACTSANTPMPANGRENRIRKTGPAAADRRSAASRTGTGWLSRRNLNHMPMIPPRYISRNTPQKMANGTGKP